MVDAEALMRLLSPDGEHRRGRLKNRYTKFRIELGDSQPAAKLLLEHHQLAATPQRSQFRLQVQDKTQTPYLTNSQDGQRSPDSPRQWDRVCQGTQTC